MGIIRRINRLIVPKALTGLLTPSPKKIESVKFVGGQNGRIDNIGFGNRLAGGLTDQTTGRANNEDSLLIVRNFNKELRRLLLAVADGAGGHENGEVVSAAIINILERHFSSGQRGRFSFDAALDDVSQWLLKEKTAGRIKTEAGSTIVGAEIDLATDLAKIYSIGDSRAYHYHNGELLMLTLDDNYLDSYIYMELANPNGGSPALQALKKRLGPNLVAEYQGLLPPLSAELSRLIYQLGTEYYNAPYVNPAGQPIFGASICKAIGYAVEKGTTASFLEIKLSPGDLLILASDGVHDFMSYDQLAKVIAANLFRSPLGIAEEIYNTLTVFGDNVTIAVHKHG
jgi:serine/threonine protein phosphatase PrpC